MASSTHNHHHHQQQQQLPHDFKCPISLEIMSDPVIISSGHTFDRSSIQRWLDAGNRTCPITKLPLPDTPALIPNHALRSLISNYALLPPNSPSSTSSLPSPPPPPPPPQHQQQQQQQYHQTLISSLVSPLSPLSSKLDSLSQLARLTKLDPALRRQLTESGALSSVLTCVSLPESDSDSALQEKALSLLLNLSLDDHNKVGLVAEGAIGRVVGVIRFGPPSTRAIACTILTSLAVVEVNKAIIGSYPNAIEGVVGLLRNGKGREVKEAATALYALCAFPDNRRRVVECGAVPVLVRIAELGLERAVEVLSVVVKCKEGRGEMGLLRSGYVVEVLVNVLRNGSEKGVQSSLFTLACLCSYSEGMCVEVKRQGVLEMCVGLVEDDNEKIRRNAATLVRTLMGRRIASLEG